MLSLFTFKKILFSLSVGSAVVAPVVATSPVIKEFSWSSSSVSPLKEGLRDLTKVDIYDGESISSFLKKSLLHKEGQEGLIESFSQELAKKWYLSQPKSWINPQIRNWDELHESQFRNAWETLKPQNPQRDFWDNYWGSKESMNSYGLRFKSHEMVQTFLSDFKISDFKINNQVNSGWDNNLVNSTDQWTKYFTSKHSFTSKEELENQANWTKIGFYPTKMQSSEKEWERITLGKFEFINWVYKKWLLSKLPIYFWKISWNYDIDANEDQLKEVYDFSELGSNFPKKASYEFPLFSSKTLSKFQEFIKKIKTNDNQNSKVLAENGGTNSLQLKEYYVPSWYGDLNASGEILELFDSFESETPELASALSYLINKLLNSQETSRAQTKPSDGQSSSINQITFTNNNYKDITELFLEKEDKTTGKSIEINSKLLKKAPQSKFSHDLRETNSGWILFRDKKGVHAIQLDGHKTFQQAKKSENLMKWINFRNLQTYISTKSSMDYETLIPTTQNWFTIFSKFFKDNFDYLFSEYYVEKGGSSLLFKDSNIQKYFDIYKETLKNLFAFRDQQTRYSRIIKLRKKIIERYSGREWTLPSNLISSNKPIVALKHGLSSVFPYSINTNNDKSVRFPDQEKILDIFSDEKNLKHLQQASDNHSGSTQGDSNLLSLLEKYYESVQKLLSNSAINLKTRSNGFNFSDSQRIFIKDPIFDFLLDKLFSKKEFLNYIVKEEKLLNSSFFDKNKLLGEKSRLDPSSGWSALLKLPSKNEIIANLKKTSSSVPVEVTPTCKYTREEEGQKTELQKLFSLLIKNYLFRNYLKSVDSNYFNFWIDFSDYKRTESTQGSAEISDSQAHQKLSDFELFSLWQNISLTDIKNKESLLDFLLTLDYLTKNKFENFKKFMTSQLSNKNKYHYLFFEVKQTQEEGEKKVGVHPFLPTNQNNGQKYFPSRKELRTFIRENWKPSDNYDPTKVNATSETKESNERTSKSFPLILHSLKINQDTIPDKNKNLFNFSDLEGLIKHIKELNSIRDLDLLVTQLSLLNWKIYPSFFKADKIFYKQDSKQNKSTNRHQEKKLYLEDKKKALIYQIKNKDQSLYASKIFTQEEIKKMFEDSLLENSVKPNENNGQTTNSMFDSNLFSRQQGKIEGGYFIQISQDDFSNDAKMCQLFEMLPGELLGEFIIQQTDNSINKQAAQDKFFEEIQKLKIHDLKFKGHLDSRYSA